MESAERFGGIAEFHLEREFPFRSIEATGEKVMFFLKFLHLFQRQDFIVLAITYGGLAEEVHDDGIVGIEQGGTSRVRSIKLREKVRVSILSGGISDMDMGILGCSASFAQSVGRRHLDSRLKGSWMEAAEVRKKRMINIFGRHRRTGWSGNPGRS